MRRIRHLVAWIILHSVASEFDWTRQGTKSSDCEPENQARLPYVFAKDVFFTPYLVRILLNCTSLFQSWSEVTSPVH
jgi:hypothetical protein